MYNNLHDRTNKNAMKAVNLALGATSLIYITVAFLGIFFFGSVLKQSILKNIGNEGDLWESYFLRFVFAIVIGCHIPFLFFPGKEALLIIIDEFNRKTISKSLQLKLDTQNGLMTPNGESLEEADKAADYKDMNPKIYYTVTIILYIIVVSCACMMDDIGVIFEFIGAICCSCLLFIIPGSFYLIAHKKFASV